MVSEDSSVLLVLEAAEAPIDDAPLVTLPIAPLSPSPEAVPPTVDPMEGFLLEAEALLWPAASTPPTVDPMESFLLEAEALLWPATSRLWPRLRQSSCGCGGGAQRGRLRQWRRRAGA